MRTRPTLLALLAPLALLLAGCGDPAAPPATLAQSLPDPADLGGMKDLPIGIAEEEFRQYGMTTNPGAAAQTAVTNFRGDKPTTAYGRILYEGEDMDDRLYMFALGFDSATAAQDFLDDGKACSAPAVRAYVRAGSTVVQLVHASLDDAPDPALAGHWQDAVGQTVAKTGGSRVC